uniref:Uncharacterized protein n=1 Tax=Kalanchoe fedtschenkoi TaxID=63787 RepID=A0A7N0VC37_KALFE
MMNSHCISRCISDVQTPVRPTYRNLYRWPESDAEFMRSVSQNSNSSSQQSHYPRVVESLSCRQMYLRSYTFSRRKETVQEKITRKCFPNKAAAGTGTGRDHQRIKKRTRSRGDGKKQMLSCVAFLRRVLACGASSVVL